MKQYRVLYETEANDGKWRTFGQGSFTSDLEEANRWLDRYGVYSDARMEVREVSEWHTILPGDNTGG